MTTPSEWLEIAAVIRDRWPHSPLPDSSLEQWGVDVADLPAEQVAAAVEVLYREGREFAPNGGQIRAKVAELMLAVPEFSFVVARLRSLNTKADARSTFPDGDEIVEHPRADALLREHPLIREFVRAVGWGQIEGGLGGGSEEARLREKWQQFLSRARREVLLRGIPASGLRELRRIESGQTKRLGDVVGEVKGELEAA